MALDDLDLPIDFHCLLVAGYWVEQHCVVPDGFLKGKPFELVWWQAWSLLNFYRLKPTATVGQLAPAFHWRRSQVVLPQKAGKAPYTSAHICNEAVGPALFAGWAKGGERWDCRDHGCGCGWIYEYQPGEAMGQPWPTPLIQITATSEEQTDNIYDALRPMIDDGPLHELIPKTGEEFIRLPNKGRIDTVTSSARSRLGQRVTFVPQDETGIWTQSMGMVKVAETQRRGLAGMGGRAEETTNAWDPNEDSVAQRTAQSKTKDIFRWHPEAPRGLSYRNKAERRKIHKVVYDGCAWIDLDAIDAEASELLERDPGQAERFFGNRAVAGEGAAFNVDHFRGLTAPKTVPEHALVVLGIDGARHDDALAIIACEVKTGYMWPLDIIERPPDAGEDYEHPKDRADGAVRGAFERYNVWRAYCDDQWIEHLIAGWQNSYGDKRVLTWRTNRNIPIAWAVRNFEDAVANGEVSHDGNARLVEHIGNSRKRKLTVLDDRQRQMHTLAKDGVASPRKMDAAMAAVLAWEARLNCISDGAYLGEDEPIAAEKPAAEPWRPGGQVLPGALHLPQRVGPMGSMS